MGATEIIIRWADLLADHRWPIKVITETFLICGGLQGVVGKYCTAAATKVVGD